MPSWLFFRPLIGGDGVNFLQFKLLLHTMMNTYKEGNREKKMKRGKRKKGKFSKAIAISKNGNELRNMSFNDDGDD